jgi:hypothetical protein
LASDYGLWVEAEIEDPAVAVLGNGNSNDVGGVGGNIGVWAVHWAAGVGAGREAVTHRRCCGWGSAGIIYFLRQGTNVFWGCCVCIGVGG